MPAALYVRSAASPAGEPETQHPLPHTRAAVTMRALRFLERKLVVGEWI
jgi:hypothetical protein